MLQRNMLLIGGTTAVALALGFVPARQQAQWCFEHSAYYVVLALVGVWLFRIGSLYAAQFKRRLPQQLPTLLLAAAVTVLIFVHSPPRFKILADESNLVGVSMLLHTDRIAAIPIEGIVSDFNPSDVATAPTKRPLLFPFLVSIIHALIGYHPTNGFVLNFAATLAALFFFAITVSRWLDPSLERPAVLVLASAPILSFYATSSGFEALNMLFMILTIRLLLEVVDSAGESKRVELLFLTALLLSQCRYESAIVLLLLVIFLIGPMLRWGSLKQMTPLGCLMPLFLLPILWQRRMFWGTNEINRIDYGVLEGTASPFGWQHLMANIDDNLFVLMGLNPNYGFTLPLSFAALVGGYLLLRNHFLKREVPVPAVVLATVMASFLALLVIISAFYWGNFGLRMDNRLALVFLPFLAFAALYGIHQVLVRRPAKTGPLLMLLLLVHLVTFWPHAARQRLINGLSLPFEYQRVVSYLRTAYDEEDQILVIAELPNLYTIQPYSTVKLDRLTEAATRLRQLQGQFDHILALQKIDNHTREVTPATRIPPPFKLVPLKEMVITTRFSIRVSECRIPDEES